MPRRLAIRIAPDGTVEAEASGTPGPDCLDAIEQLRELLAAEVVDSATTPEFDLLPLPVEEVQTQQLGVADDP